MGWGAAIAFLFKFAGEILGLVAENRLTQEHLDAAVAALHSVGPPKKEA